jgi:hypothetical protein
MSVAEIIGIVRDITIIVGVAIALLLTLRLYRSASRFLDEVTTTIQQTKMVVSTLANAAEAVSNFPKWTAGQIWQFVVGLARGRKKGEEKKRGSV